MIDGDLTRSQELQIEANNRLIEELAGKNQKLEESRKRFQDLVDQLPCVVLRFDEDGQVGYANHTWSSFVGSDPEEVVGENLESLIHEEDRGSLLRSMRKNNTVELRLIQENGEYRWVRFSCQKVSENTYQGLLVDLMETRKLEELLRRSQKMEAIGRLSGGVAHNFNNLLTVIMAAVDRLSGMIPAQSARSVKEVERIQLAAGEAASVTSQLLAFSRQQVLAPALWDVRNIFEECEILAGDLVKSPGVEFVVNKPDPDEVLVFVDKSQIHQVLLNLVLNARDAVGGTGRITVGVGTTTLGVQEAAEHDIDSGEFVQICVNDDGVGMLPQILEKIFEPFFTTKDVDKGTGFGLATSYGIMQQSGGAIRVSSEYGFGSTFEVLLPIPNGDEEKSHCDETPVDSAMEIGNVLVVDDEEMILELTCEALREDGHTVTGVSGTVEALAELSDPQNRFDLLITDVVMPDGGGRRLVEEAEKLESKPQIIIVSGYDRDFLGDDQNFGAFMQKPYSLSELLQQVQRILAK